MPCDSPLSTPSYHPYRSHFRAAHPFLPNPHSISTTSSSRNPTPTVNCKSPPDHTAFTLNDFLLALLIIVIAAWFAIYTNVAAIVIPPVAIVAGLPIASLLFPLLPSPSLSCKARQLRQRFAHRPWPTAILIVALLATVPVLFARGTIAIESQEHSNDYRLVAFRDDIPHDARTVPRYRRRLPGGTTIKTSLWVPLRATIPVKASGLSLVHVDLKSGAVHRLVAPADFRHELAVLVTPADPDMSSTISNRGAAVRICIDRSTLHAISSDYRGGVFWVGSDHDLDVPEDFPIPPEASPVLVPGAADIALANGTIVGVAVYLGADAVPHAFGWLRVDSSQATDQFAFLLKLYHNSAQEEFRCE